MNTSSLEVCYALPDKQYLITIPYKDKITIKQAIIDSGILKLEPTLDIDQLIVGIFSKKKALTDFVLARERVEIYRPLTIDPMQARRLRAEKKRRENKLSKFGA